MPEEPHPSAADTGKPEPSPAAKVTPGLRLPWWKVGLLTALVLPLLGVTTFLMGKAAEGEAEADATVAELMLALGGDPTDDPAVQKARESQQKVDSLLALGVLLVGTGAGAGLAGTVGWARSRPRCPQCAKVVRLQARVCPWCRHSVLEAPARRSQGFGGLPSSPYE